MFQILLWSPWKYRCGQRTVRMAVVACSQNQAVFARRRNELKLKQKLLDIRAELEREKENARGAVVPTRRRNMSHSSGHNRFIKDMFGDRLISRFGPVNWPPRSCDLTPLDYFLWGYVKSLVYADKPQTLDHLEDNIRRVIADIRPQMLEKVIENWTSRLDYIRASRGSPMPEIIFKM
ncbi:DUF4817 domain-containing protein [Trichonephila clavipes]|nr:DUF4817 domain-containing protein [Trichonephila clavipes]